MNEALADALLEAAAATRAAGAEAARRSGGGADGGRVTDGAALSTFVRAAVEEARLRPPGFASFRNREAESAET
eukprot:4736575-Pleurochrysis_carterae.AAC.1